MSHKAKREDYTSLVHYSAIKSGVSYYRATKILNSLCRNIQKAVFEGKDVEIRNLLKIEFSCSTYNIYNNDVYSLEEQINDVQKELNLDIIEVQKVIIVYFKRIKMLVENGFRVNIKGVGYIVPTKDDSGIYCDTRVSPVLKKPEIFEFNVLNRNGEITKEVILREQLRFKVYLSDNLVVPNKIIAKNNIPLNVVDI